MNIKEKSRNITAPEGSLVLKIVLVVIIIAFLAAVYHSNTSKNVSMGTISKHLESEAHITKEMKKQTDRQLMQFMNIDASQYAGVLYYKSEDAMNATELVIVKVSNKSDLDGVQDEMEDRIQSQLKIFEGYAPEQVALLNNAVITKRGSYIFYCTAKQPEKYEEVFLNVI
ncbi:MAG: DUF4358 domain-containing protein [Anaerovoracaceae bacterium]